MTEMSEVLQVSRFVFADLNEYKEEARERIKHELLNPPTHERCNSNCADCTKRRYCRWAPWNMVGDPTKEFDSSRTIIPMQEAAQIQEEKPT